MAKKKKCALGYSGKPYIDPMFDDMVNNQNMLMQQDIDQARIKLDTLESPLIKGLYGFGAATELAVPIISELYGAKNNSSKKALGDRNLQQNIPIEIEGGEVYQDPQGNVIEAKGPDHEQGGITTALPKGTKIFSDRIKKFGKTIAERKASRMKKIENIQNKMKKSPDDKVLGNTLKRLQEIDKAQTEEELTLQTEIESMFEARGLDGTEIPKAALGEDDLGEVVSKSNITPGDLLHIGGQVKASIAPYRTTLENRASDTPHKNMYSQYGKKAMDTLESTESGLQALKESTLKDLDLIRSSMSRDANRNARSINTKRALNITAEQKLNQQERAIENAFLEQEMNARLNKANVELGIDAQQIAGAMTADMSNRQDSDAFYKNLGQNRANIGYGMQQIGDSLNQMKTRGRTYEILDEMEKSGYEINTSSRYVMKLQNVLNNYKGIMNPSQFYSEVGIENKDESFKKAMYTEYKKTASKSYNSENIDNYNTESE